MAKYNIFYSWQSDLPKTRNEIKSAITEAAQRFPNVAVVEATSNRTGSPDIVDSLLEHIDEADLFIADLTPIYSFEKKDGTVKKSPNPNVLIELGYASKSIGWDRIICVVDGDPSELPFDISLHRMTRLNKNLVAIIGYNIENLLTAPPRPKSGMTIEELFAANLFDVDNWKSVDGQQTFFYLKDPSYRIETESDDRDGYEYYFFSQVDSRPHWWSIKLIHNGTVIEDTLGIGLDGSRFFTKCPDITSVRGDFYYTYTKGTLSYALYNFYRQLTSYKDCVRSFEDIIPIFESEEEKEEFLSCLEVTRTPETKKPFHVPESLPNGEDGLVYKRQYKAALGIIDALEVFRRERGTYHG